MAHKEKRLTKRSFIATLSFIRSKVSFSLAWSFEALWSRQGYKGQKVSIFHSTIIFGNWRSSKAKHFPFLTFSELQSSRNAERETSMAASKECGKSSFVSHWLGKSSKMRGDTNGFFFTNSTTMTWENCPFSLHKACYKMFLLACKVWNEWDLRDFAFDEGVNSLDMLFWEATDLLSNHIWLRTFDMPC